MTTDTPTITWRGFGTSERGEAVSDCGRYKIVWDSITVGTERRPYYNAWTGERPRQHLTGTFDKADAKAVCEWHKRAHP